MPLSVRLTHEIEPVAGHVRPVTIWLGIACFFVGAIGVGAALAAARYGGVGPEPAAGLALLLVGVAAVGVGLALRPTGVAYDPEIELSDSQRLLVAALAGSYFTLSVAAVATLIA